MQARSITQSGRPSRWFFWLSQPIPAALLPLYILYGVALSFVLSVISVSLLDSVQAKLPDLLSGIGAAWYIPVLLVVFAFIEEILFRGPLFFSWVQETPARLALSTIVMAIIFGLYHGSVYNIAVQGLEGLVFSALFLKGGGMQRKFWRGIGTSGATHALFDCSLWLLYVSLVH